MADKSPRGATVKKPSKTIKQKRAAKKLKLEQAHQTRHRGRDPRPVSRTKPAAHNLNQVGTDVGQLSA